MANVQIETVDSVRRRLVVEIPAEEVTREIDQAFSALRQTANVPGFRRGRVPRAVLERVAGERLRAEVMERLVQDSFVDALREEQIDAIGYPEITTESAAQAGQPLRYSATVEIKPEIEVGNYQGFDVERPLRHVEDTDVDGYLEQMRQSAARIEPIEDRSVAAADDVATIDYEARVGDRQIGKGEDRLVRVGGDDAHELGSHLVGVEVGASTEFTIAYPEDFGRPELDGKTVDFTARVKSIGVRQVPPLDDDFAKAYGGFEDLGRWTASSKRPTYPSSIEQTGTAGGERTRTTSFRGSSRTASSSSARRSHDDVANLITAQFLFLESEDPERDIHFYINSPGGSVTAGWRSTTPCSTSGPRSRRSAWGRRRAWRRGCWPPGEGQAIRPAACPDHDSPTARRRAGAGGDIDIQAREILRLRESLNNILQKHTGQSLKKDREGHRPRHVHDRQAGGRVRSGRRGDRKWPTVERKIVSGGHGEAR
jgi:hypothetical protein